MAHPFLRRRPPKTTGREEFGEPFLRWLLAKARRLRLSDADIVMTVTEFTAASIANAYRRFILPKLNATGLNKLQVILGGGGTKNPTLVRLLFEHIGVGTLCAHEDFGISQFGQRAARVRYPCACDVERSAGQRAVRHGRAARGSARENRPGVAPASRLRVGAASR
jgi:1,6-anhydro-N-acetylmuramate kinase